MAEKQRNPISSSHPLPAIKKFKPAVVQQEPVDSKNAHVIMLPELHIKEELPDSGQNLDYPAARLPPEESKASNRCITDSEGCIKYTDLKKDLKQFIEVTLEEVVERCFQKHFAQLAALISMSNKSTVPESEPDYDINIYDMENENESDAAEQDLEHEYQEIMRVTTTSPPPLVPLQQLDELQPDEIVDTIVVQADHVANHKKITNEFEATAWNEKLNDEEYFNEYVRYFEILIVPNSYVEMGDNVGFIIADHLFAPEFYQRLSWAGCKKPNNVKAPFCGFHNVIRLFYQLIVVGDPTYSMPKLEWFLRRRLLHIRGSKSRN